MKGPTHSKNGWGYGDFDFKVFASPDHQRKRDIYDFSPPQREIKPLILENFLGQTFSKKGEP